MSGFTVTKTLAIECRCRHDTDTLSQREGIFRLYGLSGRELTESVPPNIHDSGEQQS